MSNESERNDVSLCFQALGIEFGAPPEEVEKAYQRMIAEIKKKQTSTDPAARAEATKDLELAHDLYEKIRNSVTYNSRLKDVEKVASQREQVKKEAAQQFRICPSCKKTIAITIKKCPYCREPIRTPFEALIHKMFSGTNLVIIVLLTVTAIGAIVYLTYKGSQKKAVEQLPAVGSFTSFSGSGSFTNQSGAARKP